MRRCRLTKGKCFSLGQTVRLLIAVAVLFTYGLQYFVPLEIMWNGIKHWFSHKYAAIGETVMRIIMVMLTGKWKRKECCVL